MSSHIFKLKGEDVVRILTDHFDSVEDFRSYLTHVMFTTRKGPTPNNPPQEQVKKPVGRPFEVDLEENATYEKFAELRQNFKEALLKDPESFRNRRGIKAKDAAKDQTMVDQTHNQLMLDNDMIVTFDPELGPIISDD